MVMGLFSLTASTTADPPTVVAAVTMARRLDIAMLAPTANVAAFTGFFLALTTPWGLTRHWWVLVKAAITISQLCRPPRPTG